MGFFKLIGILFIMFGFLFLLIDIATVEKKPIVKKDNDKSFLLMMKDWLCSSVVSKWIVIGCFGLGIVSIGLWYIYAPVEVITDPAKVAAEGVEANVQEIMNRASQGETLDSKELETLLSTGDAELVPHGGFEQDKNGNYSLPMDEGDIVLISEGEDLKKSSYVGVLDRLVYRNDDETIEVYYEDSHKAIGSNLAYNLYVEDDSGFEESEEDSAIDYEEDCEPAEEVDYTIVNEGGEGERNGYKYISYIYRYNYIDDYAGDKHDDALVFVDVGLENYLLICVTVNDKVVDIADVVNEAIDLISGIEHGEGFVDDVVVPDN